MKRLIISAVILSLVFASKAQDVPELKVKIENIKKVKGSMKIALYNQEELFLSKEILSDGKEISESTIEFTFKGLDEGIYAVSVFHDENDNGKLDSNFMGVPSEPYAFSNNAKGMFGPPSFQDCQFTLNSGGQLIVIYL